MKAAQIRFDYLVNIYIASQFCLLIFLLSELLEIYLVSRVNIVGFRAGLIRLMGSLASVGFSPLCQLRSLGYFNVALH